MDFEAPVWRLRVDPVAGWLAIECRDADLLQTNFWVLQAETGELLGKKLAGPEPWWVGMEALHGQMLFLHGYADRQTSRHLGIWGFDGSSGNLQWAQPQLSYQGTGEHFLVARKPAPADQPAFVGLDFREGSVLTPDLPPEEAERAVEKGTQLLLEQYEVPAQHWPGTEYFNLLQDFIAERREVVPVRAIEYLETDRFILIGYYCLTAPGKLANFLAVFTLAGELVREERLSAEVAGTGAETFFTFRKKLFFVQDGKSLLSLLI